MTIVDGGPGVTERVPSDAGFLRRLWGAPLLAHATFLAVLLLALLPLMAPRGSFTSDEGAYALQVHALEAGDWSYDYRAAPYDATNEHFPIVLGDRNGDNYYPYVKQPAYPMLLWGAVVGLGDVLGLHFWSLLGALGTAVAAWLLAKELDAGLARPAFWVAAAGPVLVNGYLLWAHALSAAVAGFCLVAAIRVARHGPRRWAMLLLGAGLAAGVLLRAEGLLFAVAVTLAVAWVSLRRRGARDAAITAIVAGLPSLVALVLQGRWIHAIVGGASAPIAVRGSGGTSYVGGRISGAWHEMVAGGYQDDLASMLGLLALGLVVGMTGLAFRRRRVTWAREVTVGVALAVAVLAVRFAIAPTDPVTGLLTAWPVALLGLLFVPWRDGSWEVRLLGLASGLFVLAVLATQYPQGGGFEWGGRFLAPLSAPVAVLAVLGLRTRLRLLPGGRSVRVGVGALTVAAVAFAGLGLATLGVTRARHDALVAAVVRHPAPVVVTTIQPLPRLAWRADPEVTWMLATPANIQQLLTDLRTAGVPRVTVVGGRAAVAASRAAYPDVQRVPEPAVKRMGGELLVLSG